MAIKQTLKNVARGLAGIVLATSLHANAEQPATKTSVQPAPTGPALTLQVANRYSAPSPGKHIFVGSYAVHSGASNANPLMDELAQAGFPVTAELVENPNTPHTYLKRVFVTYKDDNLRSRVVQYLATAHKDIKPEIVEKQQDESMRFIKEVQEAIPQYHKQIAERKTNIPYFNLIEQSARRVGRDDNDFKALMSAVFEKESAFRPYLTSKKNAKGIGQIMPATGYDMLYSFKERSSHTKAQRKKLIAQLASPKSPLYNPETNIRCAAKRLDIALKDCDENIPCALRHYNAGAGNKDRQFPETVEYERRVSSAFPKYVTRIASSSKPAEYLR